MPRFHCPALLATGAELDLPPGAARHVQVLRLQPGDTITLFHGGQAEGDPGGEFDAVHLLAGITANERMDWLVEKATELGVASITPLVAERSVLKLKGERAEKKIAHWQAVAVAACEQCGRNRVPVVHNAVDLAGWVRAQAQATTVQRLLLSLRAGTAPLHTAAGPAGPVVFLSGPEGGLSSTEEDLALQHSFAPVTLGPRVLRAETAPLAALAALTLL
jgi:16S rRNA (uracil1498-N3)-methyltransferase